MKHRPHRTTWIPDTLNSQIAQKSSGKMKTKFVTFPLFVFFVLAGYVLQTDATFIAAIVGATLAAKALIVAKLVAGAALLGLYSRGFGDRADRYKRELVNGTARGTGGYDVTDIERLFAFIASNDEQFCIPRIICEVHAKKNQVKEGEVQSGILEIFKHYNTIKKPSAIAAQYRQAAILGTITDQDMCHKVYDTCPLLQNELMNVIQAANQLDK